MEYTINVAQMDPITNRYKHYCRIYLGYTTTSDALATFKRIRSLFPPIEFALDLDKRSSIIETVNIPN